MKHVRLFEQFINEGAFVIWYEDQDGKHLLGTFHNKKAAEKYKSEEEDEMLNTKGIKAVGMMSKDMWYKKEAPYINENNRKEAEKHANHIINQIQDMINNDEEVDSAYYLAKDYFEGDNHNPLFNTVVDLVEEWMKKNM